MLTIGLTGGVGSGKSTVAAMFAEHGIPVTDTDAIAHQLTAPGQPAVHAIAQLFGPWVLTADGALDRAALRRRVFSDPAAREMLEALLHPMIRAAVAEALAAPARSAPYRMVVVPLLFESGGYAELLQRTLTVDCPEALQIQRAMARSRLTEAEVRAIMAAQLPRAERLARADDVLVNDADLATLAQNVAALHQKYLLLSRQSGNVVESEHWRGQ
jgi:dephospho-CoA kinase